MPPLDVQLRRLPRLIVGLWLFGVGIALVVLGDQGLPGWDVFHQGLAEQTPLSIGAAISVVGAAILVLVLILGEPVGIGTLGNVVLIGLSVDVTLWLIDEPTNLAVRVILTLSGPAVIAIGSGLYLGVRLGPGPRDGLMTAIGRRGVKIWKARFGVEAAALLAGVALGGTVGWGTIWFLVVIGPMVQLALPPLSVPLTEGESETLDTH